MQLVHWYGRLLTRQSRRLDLPAAPRHRSGDGADRAHAAPHDLGDPDRGAPRRARRHRLRPVSQLGGGPVAHGAGPPRALDPQLPPRPLDDPRLRRLAGLAARGGLRAARRGALAQRALAAHAERLARARAVRADRAHHALEHARRAPRAVHRLRPRQGPRRAHGGLQARAEERHHPDAHRDRDHLRAARRRRRGHRDGVQYPGAGPAHHLRGAAPRLPGDPGRGAADRRLVHRDQPARGPGLPRASTPESATNEPSPASRRWRHP